MLYALAALALAAHEPQRLGPRPRLKYATDELRNVSLHDGVDGPYPVQRPAPNTLVIPTVGTIRLTHSDHF
jgi:hypothetical protein